MSKMTVSSTELHNAASNASLFTAADKMGRPVLSHAKVSWDDADLVFEATDSYALIRETVFVAESADSPGTVFIDRDGLKSIATFSRAQKGLPIVLIHEGHTLTIAGGASQVTIPIMPETELAWPNTASLFDAFVSAPAESVGIGAQQYARLGKLKSDQRTGTLGATVRWECGGTLKPSRFTLTPQIVGLIMPVRIPA